jgi:hypothetical protein
MAISDQATGAASDLQGWFPRLFARDTWLRTLIALVVVGALFTFIVLPLLRKVPKVGKYIPRA